MATKDEILQEIESCQRAADDCDKQLDRLEPVYREISDIKRDFRKARASTEDVFREKSFWRGEKYTEFCRAGDMLNTTCGSYYTQLDAAHDALNRKIGDLKAAKREKVWLIGNLWAQLEQLKVDVENVLN